jgi:hypothetical protein
MNPTSTPRQIRFAILAFGLGLLGWGWSGAAFVAAEPAWWNSIWTIVLIFAFAFLASLQAWPSALGVMALLFTGGSCGIFLVLAVSAILGTFGIN